MERTVVKRPLLGRLAKLLCVGAILGPRVVSAQSAQQQQAAAEQRIREQRDELDRVRHEREELERQAADLRNTAHDLSDLVSNLNRRVEASTKLVHGLDQQLTMISAAVDTANDRLAGADSDLTTRRGALQRRAIEVYKRGPLFTVEAMLSARSFGELVARYKYLHELTLHDQALVRRVESLRDDVARERTNLVTLQQQLTVSRADRTREASRLKDVQKEQTASLRVVRQQAKDITSRIERQNRSIAQMEAMIASLEEARRKAVAAAAAAAAAAARSGSAARPVAPRPVTSTIKTSDYGKLDWPVDGSVLYSFGKQHTASKATIHWNGIGIQAPLGSDVHVVAAGNVSVVRRLDLYGLTVIIDHGAGDYTIYGSLEKALVKEGEAVVKGQAIGTVGRGDPSLPDHLHFEIRTGGRDAVDPIRWLKAHR